MPQVTFPSSAVHSGADAGKAHAGEANAGVIVATSATTKLMSGIRRMDQ